MTTIALVDDEPLFTAGLAMIIDSQKDLEVIWQADSGTLALERQQRNPADVILMDIQMPVLDGLETTAELIARGLPGRVMVLTTFDTDDHVIHAIETGASGFLLKIRCTSRKSKRQAEWRRLRNNRPRVRAFFS